MNKLLTAFSTAALLLAGVFCTSASAAWPDRPVKMIIGSGAGSTLDMGGRLIAQKLSDKFGQPFVVQNVKSGSLGGFTMTLKNAKADGYSIGFGMDINFTYNSLEPNAQFKMDDFEFICSVFQGNCGYIVAPDKSWKNLKEVLEYSKTAPKPVNYLFLSSNDRRIMEKYIANTGAKINLVPCNSGPAMVTAIIGGHGDFAMSGGVHVEQERAGKVRTITMSTVKRSPQYPDVPTVSELMNPAYPIDMYRLLMVPKGFPADAKKALADAVAEIVNSDEFKAALDKMHFFPSYLTGKDLDAELARQLAVSRELLK